MLLFYFILLFLPISDSTTSVLWTDDVSYPWNKELGENGTSDTFGVEAKLKELLLDGYDRTSRPLENSSAVLTVNIGVSLFHILDTVINVQQKGMYRLGFAFNVTIKPFLHYPGLQRWTDEFLGWDKAEWPLRRIWMPIGDIWTPDVVINNNADHTFTNAHTNAIVHSTGAVLWMYPSVSTTYCTLNVRYFPFDTQFCEIVFISWTYSMAQLNLDTNELDKHTSYYQEINQEWRLMRISAVRHEKFYVCCEEKFADVTVVLQIERRSTFYIINLIFPCLLIYVVNFMSFFLPVSSSDKVNLEITILLAMVVFLMVILDILPPTPDAIPLLGMFYGATMVMVSLTLLMGVIVTLVHHRHQSQPMPAWLRYLIRKETNAQGEKNPRQRGKKPETATNLAHQEHSAYCLSSIANTVQPQRTDMPNLTETHDLEMATCSRSPQHSAAATGVMLSPSILCRLARLASISETELTSIGPSDDDQPHATNTGRHPSQDQPAFEDVLHDTDDCNGDNNDWRKLARELDRIFFWVFLALSVAMLSAIASQIPARTHVGHEHKETVSVGELYNTTLPSFYY